MLYAFLILALSCQEYVFVPSDKTPASIFIYNSSGMYSMLGFIDKHGVFIPESVKNIKALKKSGHPVEINSARDSNPAPLQTPNYINKPRWSGEDVYEYRSGKLIPGYLDRNYYFIPDGEKVIDFSVYEYSDEARRIYNLPGKFVTAAEYRKLQEKK